MDELFDGLTVADFHDDIHRNRIPKGENSFNLIFYFRLIVGDLNIMLCEMVRKTSLFVS
mgnify:CR=1 FL=1